MGNSETKLVTASQNERVIVWSAGVFWHQRTLYFGDWGVVTEDGREYSRSNTQYNAFEFSFRGPTVKWIGSTRSNHGHADVYIDGTFQRTVDCYSATTQADVVKFEKSGLGGDRIHTLRVVVRKERNPHASDCYQDVSSFQCVTPVCYPAEIAALMTAEYARIQNGTKEHLAPETWSPVANAADAPDRGVTLGSGVFRDVFERNIDYLNHCFASPTYCDGVGWTEWLPASNEGRMLAGSGHILRWGERADMRAIVDTVVARIESRMREDGFYNYYGESDSYVVNPPTVSERKNYDRVFWTRGLLAAGMAGHPRAHGLLRRMYDWLNSSPHLPLMLLGGNATNGLPGGPMVYLSPAGKAEDLVVTERYYDQDYWMNELANREPLCLCHYPGERPHCYELLGLEAFVDEYRATGVRKYIDAVDGGWEIYRDNYQHIGGATAIMEGFERCPPRSYHFATRRTGETCGSVFWIYINSKLLHLRPTEERYAAEIEQAIYNVIMANQDSRGYVRYYSGLHGTKHKAGCKNTCCEVSSAGMMARLPEYVYSVSVEGLYVNLYASSAIAWVHGGQKVALETATDFPFDPAVSMRVSTETATAMSIRVRVPSWATGDMIVQVNGVDHATGRPGSYLSLDRTWSDNDSIRFTLPIGFRAVKYTGLDQIAGNHDRHALMHGPILMALQGDLSVPGGVPRLAVSPEDLPGLLTPVEGDPLAYRVAGHPGYSYIPYWRIDTQTFTCFPVVEP